MSDEPRYELWQRVAPDRPGYRWMVWEIGPMTGAERWFTREEDARKFMEAQVAAQENKA